MVELGIVNLAGALVALWLGAWLAPMLRGHRSWNDTGARPGERWTGAWRRMRSGAPRSASIVAGVGPAFSASDAAPALNASTSRTAGSRGGRRLRSALLVAQTALCVALLVSGGLLVRALARTAATAPVTIPTACSPRSCSCRQSRYANGPERVAAMERVFERVAAIPGVSHAGATMNRFQAGFSYVTAVDIENQPSPDGSAYTVQFRRVSSTYFATMRIRLIAGRLFTIEDSLSDAKRRGDQPDVRRSFLARRRSDWQAAQARQRRDDRRRRRRRRERRSI